MIKIIFNNSSTSYDAKFKRVNANLISLVGNIPENTSGFKAYSGETLLGDYSDFTTIYRKFTGGIEFSNNGSVEPEKNVKIKAFWIDDLTHIPDTVTIVTNKGNDTLKKSEDWEKTYTVKVSDDVNLISAQDVNRFTKVVGTKDIYYTYISPVPSQEQRIIDLEEAVCELYERIG